MNALQPIPVSASEAHLGLRAHLMRKGVPIAPRPRECTTCGSNLSPRNKSSKCWICKTHLRTARTFDGNGKTSTEANLPSTMDATKFTGAPVSCVKCRSEQFKRVCPQQWPIWVAAVSCVSCGSILGYLDEVISLRIAESGTRPEKSPRQHVVRHGISVDRSVFDSLDALRNVILMGLENGMSIDDVADTANVQREYVHAVAVKSGLARNAA